MLRFGPATGPVVVVALPLFEEANRTRAFAVTILRALAARGIGGALPDLPGQGESLVPLETLSILTMQDAFGCAVEHIEREGRPCVALSIRSGALLDALGLLFGRWHLSPLGGARLLRELTRTKQAELGSGYRLAENWWFADDVPDQEGDWVTIAGNRLSHDLLTDLTVKTPFSKEDGPDIPLRIARLEPDPADADIRFPGSPLWRRAEPDNDPILAELIADDIAQWIATCVD